MNLPFHHIQKVLYWSENESSQDNSRPNVLGKKLTLLEGHWAQVTVLFQMQKKKNKFVFALTHAMHNHNYICMIDSQGNVDTVIKEQNWQISKGNAGDKQGRHILWVQKRVGNGHWFSSLCCVGNPMPYSWEQPAGFKSDLQPFAAFLRFPVLSSLCLSIKLQKTKKIFKEKRGFMISPHTKTGDKQIISQHATTYFAIFK